MHTKTWLQLTALPLFAALAIGSSSPKKDGDDKASTTSTTSASGIGTAVVVGDAEWTILDVVNRGSKMKANESYEKDATTTGTFVQVHFKIVNKGKAEGTMGDVPKLLDPGGREFGTVESASAFRPKDTSGVFLDKINPTLSKEFTEIYELPPGITTISLKAHDFGIFGKDKTINLGTLPPAPAVAAAPATPVKGAAAAPAAAKAKAAPPAKK